MTDNNDSDRQEAQDTMEKIDTLDAKIDTLEKRGLDERADEVRDEREALREKVYYDVKVDDDRTVEDALAELEELDDRIGALDGRSSDRVEDLRDDREELADALVSSVEDHKTRRGMAEALGISQGDV